MAPARVSVRWPPRELVRGGLEYGPRARVPWPRAYGPQKYRRINREYSSRAGLAERRRGVVFPDRFHQEIITSPTQARHTLSYVLNNWRKHEEDRMPHAHGWNADPFSTGVLFEGWKEREHEPLLWKWRDTYDPLVVHRPRTWLLREGWMRGGGTISFRDVPRSKKLRQVRAS